MEHAWAATFGRFQPEVFISAGRSQQIGRLFQAKRRANTGTAEDQTALEPQSIQRQDAVEEQTSAQPIRQSEAPARTKPPPPTTGGSALASRLLERKRQKAEQRKDDS